VIGAAVMVAKIATGEIEDEKREKNPHAVALGKLGGAKGGAARSAKMTEGQLTRAARLAARARWAKSRNPDDTPKSHRRTRKKGVKRK